MRKDTCWRRRSADRLRSLRGVDELALDTSDDFASLAAAVERILGRS
jgi:hypothetical protein